MKPHKALDRIAKGSDSILHGAVIQTELSRQLDGYYVQIVTDDEDVGRFREVKEPPYACTCPFQKGMSLGSNWGSK